MATEKKKKHKHPHTEMQPGVVCRIGGCGHPIKRNVVERSPNRNHTCYFHGMLEVGKTHIGGEPIKELIKARNRRVEQK